MAQSVEHVIGNDEVISSILITSSKKATHSGCFFCFLYKKVGRQFALNCLPYVFNLRFYLRLFLRDRHPHPRPLRILE